MQAPASHVFRQNKSMGYFSPRDCQIRGGSASCPVVHSAQCTAVHSSSAQAQADYGCPFTSSQAFALCQGSGDIGIARSMHLRVTVTMLGGRAALVEGSAAEAW